MRPIVCGNKTIVCKVNNPEEIRVDTALIPEYVRMDILRVAFEEAKMRINDPDFQAKYAAWKAAQDAKKAEVTA